MTLSNGWVTAIVLGAALGVVLLILLVWFMTRRKPAHNNYEPELEEDPGSAHDKWDALLAEMEVDHKRWQDATSS